MSWRSGGRRRETVLDVEVEVCGMELFRTGIWIPFAVKPCGKPKLSVLHIGSIDAKLRQRKTLDSEHTGIIGIQPWVQRAQILSSRLPSEVLEEGVVFKSVTCAKAELTLGAVQCSGAAFIGAASKGDWMGSHKKELDRLVDTWRVRKAGVNKRSRKRNLVNDSVIVKIGQRQLHVARNELSSADIVLINSYQQVGSKVSSGVLDFRVGAVRMGTKRLRGRKGWARGRRMCRTHRWF